MIKDPKNMREFVSTESYVVEGRGRTYITQNPSGLDEPNDLCGLDVEINGVVRYIKGVESFAVCRPYPEGWHIGLLADDNQPSSSAAFMKTGEALNDIPYP